MQQDLDFIKVGGQVMWLIDQGQMGVVADSPLKFLAKRAPTQLGMNECALNAQRRLRIIVDSAESIIQAGIQERSLGEAQQNFVRAKLVLQGVGEAVQRRMRRQQGMMAGILPVFRLLIDVVAADCPQDYKSRRDHPPAGQ